MKAQDHISENHELAGEYVLGTLQDHERDQFERHLASDYTLQQEVSAWEQRLGPMLETVEPVNPPLGIWKEIEKRIEPRASQEQSGIWNSLNFWRGLSLVTASLVLGLSLSLFGLFQSSGELERIMVVTNHESQAGWIVDTRSRDPMLNVSAVQPTPLAASEVCQLWLETPEGVLVPMGVLPHQGTRKMQIPTEIRQDSRFKVTIESAVTAPVERPSEEIVFEGKLISI
ncbi:MAG: anti-sigma factor [Pseudomonadota bacterium]